MARRAGDSFVTAEILLQAPRARQRSDAARTRIANVPPQIQLRPSLLFEFCLFICLFICFILMLCLFSATAGKMPMTRSKNIVARSDGACLSFVFISCFVIYYVFFFVIFFFSLGLFVFGLFFVYRICCISFSLFFILIPGFCRGAQRTTPFSSASRAWARRRSPKDSRCGLSTVTYRKPPPTNV